MLLLLLLVLLVARCRVVVVVVLVRLALARGGLLLRWVLSSIMFSMAFLCLLPMPSC